MFGSKRRKREKLNLEDLMEQLKPELRRESLGVGPAFPGVPPNPLFSGEARQRIAELREGALALGVLVDWHEINNDGRARLILMLDVETVDGTSFRGIADELFTMTELIRLSPGQTIPVRHRPAVMDHYVAIARDADPDEVQRLADDIARRKRG